MVLRGIHIALYEGSEGVKFVFMLRLWIFNINKVIALKMKKYPKAPEMADPSMLAEKGTGKIIEPEDMNRPVEFDKPIQPEDM